MTHEKSDLSLKERVNLALAKNWKLAVVILIAVILVMAGILAVDYANRKKTSDSAVLAEDIREAYVEWVQQAPESRSDEELNGLTDRALEQFPRHFASQRALFTRGLMSLEKKDWDGASSAFIELVDQWPVSYLAPVALYNAAAAREEAGDLGGAASHWLRLIEEYGDMSPDAPEALFNLGRLAETQGDREKALEYYRNVGSRYPESRWTDLSKSRILVLEGRS